MAVISLASVLDDPAKRIPINAMVRAAAIYPAKDDALIEGMRHSVSRTASRFGSCTV